MDELSGLVALLDCAVRLVLNVAEEAATAALFAGVAAAAWSVPGVVAAAGLPSGAVSAVSIVVDAIVDSVVGDAQATVFSAAARAVGTIESGDCVLLCVAPDTPGAELAIVVRPAELLVPAGALDAPVVWTAVALFTGCVADASKRLSQRDVPEFGAVGIGVAALDVAVLPVAWETGVTGASGGGAAKDTGIRTIVGAAVVPALLVCGDWLPLVVAAAVEAVGLAASVVVAWLVSVVVDSPSDSIAPLSCNKSRLEGSDCCAGAGSSA